ncbi:hypothetical protein PM082_013916 [Marasmius tenuissimus]|nr:hypothetical protein PM082_013916 [Marasmius tenuissimus]
MSLSPPEELKSKKFFAIAELKAAEGKADEVQKYLSKILQEANSKEPGTLMYRTTRGVGSDSDKFTVIEEYLDKGALDQHLQSQAFKDFFASGTVADVSCVFREEFQ